MVYIAYYTELNLQNGNNAQKQRICRGNSKNAPDEIFLGIFALAQRLPTSATLECSTSRGSNTSNYVKFYFKFKQICLCTYEWLPAY